MTSIPQSLADGLPPDLFHPKVWGLLAGDRLPELGPGQPVSAVRSQLAQLTPREVLAVPVVDANASAACLAGLWLWFDYLHESHEISQGLHTAEGSYWHAIMHRREPDYSNSKYWWRQTGEHPVFALLGPAARELAGDEPPSAARFLAVQASWDPYRFVDLCQQAASGPAPLTLLCQRIQRLEIHHLLHHCGHQAAGW